MEAYLKLENGEKVCGHIINISFGRKVALKDAKMSKCQMYVYSGHALSYTKLVHRHATQTEGNKYFK